MRPGLPCSVGWLRRLQSTDDLMTCSLAFMVCPACYIFMSGSKSLQVQLTQRHLWAGRVRLHQPCIWHTDILAPSECTVSALD